MPSITTKSTKPAPTPVASAAPATKGTIVLGTPKVSVKNPPTAPVTKEKVAAADAAVASTTPKETLAAAAATTPIKTAKAPKAPKPPKEPKPERVFENDIQTGMVIRNPLSYRWVCVEALRRVWTDLASFSQEAATEMCKTVYAERGGEKDIPDSTWERQCLIMRLWLRSPSVNKAFPGDISVSPEKTPEQRKAMLERLAKGRAKRAEKLKGASASIDEQDEAEEQATEEV